LHTAQCSCTAVLTTPAYLFLPTFLFHCTTSYIFCSSPLIHFCFPLLFFSPLQVLTLYLKSILFLVVLLLELLPPPHPSILHLLFSFSLPFFILFFFFFLFFFIFSFLFF